MLMLFFFYSSVFAGEIVASAVLFRFFCCCSLTTQTECFSSPSVDQCEQISSVSGNVLAFSASIRRLCFSG